MPLHRTLTRRSTILAHGVVSLCLAAGLSAQTIDTLSHQSWSTEDGLPQSSVHSIAQTADGYLWVATEAGLARFDGIQFQVFTHHSEPALHSDDICCLVPDGDGLSIGTREGTAYRNRQGFQWRGQSVAFPSTANNNAWSWSPDQVHGPLRGGRQLWRPGVDLPSGRISLIAVDRSGNAWVGITSGLAVIEPTGKAHVVPALNGASVLSIFEDAQGNHWIGTESSGLHVLRRQLFRSLPALLDAPTTSVTRTSDGTTWLGTRENGLYRIRNGVVDQPIPNRSLTSPVILCLQPAADGGLWVGTPDGLTRITPQQTVVHITTASGLPDDYIRSLAVAPDGSLWVGTPHGLDHIQGEQHHIFTTTEGLGGDLIGALLVDAGSVWAATSGGLSHIAPNGTIRTFTAADGLTSLIVSALAMDAARHLWLATRDGTIFTLIGDHLHALFTINPVASTERTVQSIVFDPQGSLWIQLDRGIERIRAAQLDRCLQQSPCELSDDALIHYGRAEGLRNNESVTTALGLPWLMPQGELWFPTRAGVAIADTASLNNSNRSPPVVIERVTLDDREIDTRNTPEIPFGRSRLSIEYAGLDFTSPSGVRYRYRLDGFDHAWQSVEGRRSGTYTNLPPGLYTFHVQARTNDGDWGTVEATLQLKILPPFYRRWWFIVLAAVCVCLLLVAIYLLRLRVVRHRFRAVLAERNRMAREIHDTLTQDFVSMCLQLDIVGQQLRRGHTDKAIEQVQRARRFVTEGLEEARQSIHALRSSEARETLPAKLRHLAERETFRAIHPRVSMSGEYRRLRPRAELEIVRLANEALVNVVRHAESPETMLTLQYLPDALILTVQDHGKGFSVEDAAKMEGHFGLMGMRERASVVDGDLKIVSAVGHGTAVTLHVPLTPAVVQEEGDE